MKEVVGNIWDYHKQGHWIVITTNGTVKSNGEAVMGRGIALQAKRRFPDLPYRLGQAIRAYGNKVIILDGPGGSKGFRMLSFPVKYNWREGASLVLIEESCKHLAAIISSGQKIYMVRPGCGSGQLDWKDVKPILETYLDDRFTVVNSIK